MSVDLSLNTYSFSLVFPEKPESNSKYKRLERIISDFENAEYQAEKNSESIACRSN
jgi:hypothetical protein